MDFEDEEELYFEPVTDYAEHDPQHSHCLNCHKFGCQYTGDDCCPLEACSSCSIPLHHCKIEDHKENICFKQFVPCLNASFGCRQKVRRDRLGLHLAICPASVVVCTREWCRKAHTEKEKIVLKDWGKNKVTRVETTAPDDSPDVAWTLHDQDMIIKSYGYGRKARVRRRERIHPKHPILPMRSIDEETDAHRQDDADNSSDEEKRIKAEKLRKKQAMFANCWMCHVDPTTQHLHTLGNDRTKYELMKPVKRHERPVDVLHSKYNLMIDITLYTFHDSYRKGSNLGIFTNGGSLLYNFRCLRNVHRLDYGKHHLAMHSNIFDTLQDYVLRCPNFVRGCDFIASRCRPAQGSLRYFPEIRQICHTPNTDEICDKAKNGDSISVDMLPDWVYEEVAKYLPGTALFNLSLCSKSIRWKVFHILRSHCLIVPKWKKRNGKWVLEKFAEELSIAEKSPQLQWQPPSELNQHLQNCRYFEKSDFGGAEKVPVFLDNLEKLTEEFGEKIPKYQAYWQNVAVLGLLLGNGTVALNAWV